MNDRLVAFYDCETGGELRRLASRYGYDVQSVCQVYEWANDTETVAAILEAANKAARAGLGISPLDIVQAIYVDRISASDLPLLQRRLLAG